jgi:hypothetical protein
VASFLLGEQSFCSSLFLYREEKSHSGISLTR